MLASTRYTNKSFGHDVVSVQGNRLVACSPSLSVNDSIAFTEGLSLNAPSNRNSKEENTMELNKANNANEANQNAPIAVIGEQPTYEQLKAQLAALEAAKKAEGRTTFPVDVEEGLYNNISVSLGPNPEKGNLCIYGLQRFPFSFYWQQLEAIGIGAFGLTQAQFHATPIGLWIAEQLEAEKLSTKDKAEQNITPSMVSEAFRLSRSKNAEEKADGIKRLNTYGLLAPIK